MTEPSEDASEPSASGERPLDVLFLVKSRYLSIEALRQYLECLETHSVHRLRFADIDEIETEGVDFSGWDAVAVHWSVRVAFDQVGPRTAEALTRFAGLRVLFLQDEYQQSAHARRWIREHGVHLVFTVVPEQYVAAVYPREEIGAARFVPLLTGYVSDSLLQRAQLERPHRQRDFALVYRGREHRPWFGDLYREKVVIGERVAAAAQKRGLAIDISCKESDRILGPAWFDFLQSGRACLATESGSNVFDENGDLQGRVERRLAEDPSLTYEQVKDLCGIEEHPAVRMNQISPRVFEAVALRTALVCIEGEYSGVLEPEKHFIPLRKDYSNLCDVLRRLDDVDAIEAMAERAYRHVIEGGSYSGLRFAQRVDEAMVSTFRSARLRSVERCRRYGLDLGGLLSAAIEAEREAAADRIERLGEARQGLLRGLASSRETLERLRSQNAELRRQRESAQQSLEALRRSLANKTEALERTREQNERLRERGEVLQDALDALRGAPCDG